MAGLTLWSPTLRIEIKNDVLEWTGNDERVFSRTYSNRGAFAGKPTHTRKQTAISIVRQQPKQQSHVSAVKLLRFICFASNPPITDLTER